MSAKNLFRSFLCILTAVSSITLPVYAKEETDVLNTVQRDEVHVETEETDVPLYNIEIFTSEGEGGWYDYVYQNEEISFLPGMSWDEENHVLSITDLNQPKWQLYFSCEGYEDEPVRLNIHGENVICAMETDIPMEVSGEGSLSTGYVIASYFVMNSGTLNLKSELLKEYYINYNENEDMGIGSAIYNMETDPAPITDSINAQSISAVFIRGESTSMAAILKYGIPTSISASRNTAMWES